MTDRNYTEYRMKSVAPFVTELPASPPVAEPEVRLRDALRWLVNLHHGVGKAGRSPEAGEWQAAIDAGVAALAPGPMKVNDPRVHRSDHEPARVEDYDV